MNTNAFIAGSRAYGTPRKNSDTDLVILVTPETRAKLEELNENDRENEYGYSQIRFGGLNIVALVDQEEFDVWKQTTWELVQKKQEGTPTGHDEACEIFRKRLTPIWNKQK